MKLFRHQYRVESTRLSGWDYRSSGYYFVTICTKGREVFFGEVVEGVMFLSPMGKIVATELQAIAVRRRDAELDTWAIMPNHIHTILVLKGDGSVETPHRQRRGIAPSNYGAGTPRRLTERIQRGVSTASRLAGGSLGAIIGQFKSRSTKRIWREGFRDFDWQDGFYDHIVRDEYSLNQIRQYIADNPLKWELDKDNVENLYM